MFGPPNCIILGDSVWRLKNIAKEGAFHNKLEQNSIRTVDDFARMLTVKPEELRAVSFHSSEK